MLLALHSINKFKALLLVISIGSWLEDPSYLQIQEGGPIMDIHLYALQASPTCPFPRGDTPLTFTMVPLEVILAVWVLTTTTISRAVATFYLPEVLTLLQVEWT